MNSHSASMESLLVKDPLQEMDGPMTRSRIRRMKEDLQGLILDLHEKEVAWDKSNQSSRLVTLIWANNSTSWLL